MNILEQVKSFQAQGIYCVPVPVGKKQPETKHLGKYNNEGKKIYEWKNVDWTDQDFIKADAFGIEHEKSNIIDIDFDNLEALKFRHLLPLDTLIIGKVVDGNKIATHYFYRYEGNKKTLKHFEDRNKKDSVIVEILTNTQTVAGGGNRITIQDYPPKNLTDSEYSELIRTVRKICLMTMLTQYYPKEGGRDQYCLIIAGCLARYTDWPTWEKEDFLREICKAVGDEEINNRLAKISYQEEQFKLNKEVYGIEAFSKEIKLDKSICGDWWNWVNNRALEETTPITALTLLEFVERKYPPAEYLLYPLVAKEKIIQIWAAPGIGKTLFSLELACALANGQNFLKYEWWNKSKPIPVLYVEGEMSAIELQERVNHTIERYRDENIEFNYDLFKIAPLREQLNNKFDPLNIQLGQKRLELQLEQITKQFNQRPIVFLDNVSCLTNFQEKDGKEWNSLMNFLIRLRSLGYTIIFLHHATKEGSTSSGSNAKERPVDMEIKLSEPEKWERQEIPNATQIKVEFRKWREFNYTAHAKPFLVSVARDSFKFSCHEIKHKKKEKEIAFEYWFVDEDKKVWEEDMEKHDEYPISKASFYSYRDKLIKKNKQQTTDVKEPPFK